ncbi:ABC transporter ATP-binding protein [Candidatus Dojkabacteria bacterium]|nr:ABC transporter ATP-binding protein [Candidatus Dojkabacteria bacterium]
MANKSIITVQDLRKTYGDLKAVDGVSFEVYENEIFGILGPNGAGKTTTLEMIEGLKQIDEGIVEIDGINVAQKPEAVKKIVGIQLQSSAYFEYLNITELLDLFGTFYKRKIDAKDLIDKVNLEGKEKSYVKQLSGGQQQRMSIASSLVNDPKVLFLDEPTTGLDPQARRSLWDLIEEIRNTDKKTIVLTTHYMDEAEQLCDRVAIMDDGKIITIDTPANLIKNLLSKGFKPRKRKFEATLEDVFLDLTGKKLRD